jgi:hypothetical protein
MIHADAEQLWMPGLFALFFLVIITIIVYKLEPEGRISPKETEG